MTRVYSVISALTSSFCAWQDMGHRKRPRLSGKKGARKHGGGQRKAAQPADDRFEADSDASGSEASSSSSASLQSAEDSGKATKASALASPRSSTPLPDASAILAKALRKAKKLLREIEAIDSKRASSRNPDEVTKLRRWEEVRAEVNSLEAELGEMYLSALDDVPAGHGGTSGEAGGEQGGEEGGERGGEEGEAEESEPPLSFPVEGYRSVGCLSSNSSNASLADMAAGMHGDEASGFYEEPEPPSPLPGMPPLRIASNDSRLVQLANWPVRRLPCSMSMLFTTQTRMANRPA